MSIPRHVQAWAKVHDVKPTFDLFVGAWLYPEHDKPLWQRVPDANSDAWIAGMVRKMAADGLFIAPPDSHSGWAVKWGDNEESELCPTLEDSIINAVLGDAT